MPDLTHLDPCGCRLDLATEQVADYCPAHRPLYLTDVADLNRRLSEAQQARAVFAAALEAVTRLCLLRQSGFCFLSCPGHLLCRHDDLAILPWADLPEGLKEVCQP